MANDKRVFSNDDEWERPTKDQGGGEKIEAAPAHETEFPDKPGITMLSLS